VQEEFLRKREEELAEREIDLLERELNMIIVQQQGIPTPKKRKGEWHWRVAMGVHGLPKVLFGPATTYPSSFWGGGHP
jgi:hypothetical protein